MMTMYCLGSPLWFVHRWWRHKQDCIPKGVMNTYGFKYNLATRNVFFRQMTSTLAFFAYVPWNADMVPNRDKCYGTNGDQDRIRDTGELKRGMWLAQSGTIMAP